MSLRRRVLLYTILIFFSLVLVIFFISRYIILENLAEVEEKITYQNIERARNALFNIISNLESITEDWASWDDTYDFIEDQNEKYIETNLVDGTFVGLDINLVMIVNTAGKILLVKSYNLENYETILVPEKIEEYFSSHNKIIDLTFTDGGSSGILYLPNDSPLLIASRPILTSKDEGPVRGTLIFGRNFGPELITKINNITSLNITSYYITENSVPDEIHKIFISLVQEAPIQTRILDEHYVAGYSLIYDIYEDPGLIIEVIQPRDIYQESQLGIRFLLLALVISGVVFIFIALILMNKQGLSRLANMVKIVEDIGKTGNIRERIPIQGDDEMTLLAERINSMLGVLQELYEKEAQLRHSLETEMNRRIDFTRALVHELKTPLTPLLTSSDILVSEISTEPYASLAKNINRGALRLENRINELLDLAKGEIGTLVLTPLIIQPSELLKSIIDEMKPVVASQGLSLNLDIPASLPSFQGDEERLRQVLLNLLNNACRFSPEGGIITIKVTERDNSLSVEVLDRGPGIREEELEKVFLPYYRSDYENKRYSGLGIGLALSKMLIELHKGKIWARNREGGGSIFGFSVPLDTTE